MHFGRVESVLAVLVLSGFAVSWWVQGTPAFVRVSELADGPSRLVVLTGQARVVNGTYLKLCQGADCIRVISKGPMGESIAGRTVAVQGRFQGGTLWADAAGVDLLG